MEQVKRTISKTFSRKGKETATSSSQPPSQPPKRRLILQHDSEEERSPQHEEEVDMDVDDDDSAEKPDWRVGTSLHTFPFEWQSILFKDKMAEAESLKKQLICERKVEVKDFRGFGLIDCFEKMGWRQALLYNNKDSPDVYLDGIMDWMGTLERIPGDNPPETMMLVGTVNNKRVTMSFETLNKIVKFDHGSTIERNTDYLPDNVLMGISRGDNWYAMLAELFDVNRVTINNEFKLDRQYLKPLPRLLMSVLSWNVTPRTSDKSKIRFYEVVVLYALVTGNLALSLRQIIMLNIWEARNKRNKTSIPHPRLITHLIKNHKAVPKGVMMTNMPQVSLTMARVTGRGSEWKLEETPQARILRETTGRGYLVAPNQGFTREAVIASMENRGTAGASGSNVERPEGDESGQDRRDTGLLGAGIRYERPQYYQDWTPYEQTMWDMSAQQAEERRRFERGMVYAHELDIRRRFEYEEQVRHHHDYLEGRDYIEVPPRTDYRDLERFNRGSDIPPYYPQSYDSDWLPRQSCVARIGESSSAPPPPPPEDPFDTRSLYNSLWESVFGPHQQQ